MCKGFIIHFVIAENFDVEICISKNTGNQDEGTKEDPANEVVNDFVETCESSQFKELDEDTKIAINHEKAFIHDLETDVDQIFTPKDKEAEYFGSSKHHILLENRWQQKYQQNIHRRCVNNELSVAPLVL